MATYTVVLMREPDGRYSVSVPALPGCLTWGGNLPEALRMAQEAIEAYVGGLRIDGEPVPEDVTRFEVDLGDAMEAVVYRGCCPGAPAS